ncbi:MAG: hypothetical protein Q9187_000717 [Circinaria calcarea]
MSEYEVPPSPFHRRLFRKTRRQFRSSKRHWLIISTLVILVLVILHFTKRFAIYSTSTGLFECDSNRLNVDSIPVPSVKNPARLADTWNTLRTIFDAHPPKPSNLPRLKHKSDGEPPAKEELKHLLNITESDAHATRIEHTAVMRHIPPYPEALFSGRGIAMLAGGRYSEFAATALGMLREVGSKLPVEVWMKDKTEEKQGWCSELEKEGMVCRRLSDHMNVTALSHPYQWKVFVMLFSSFEELLFLDADSIPIKDPDPIFDSEAYRDKGAILWPDYWKHTGSPWLPYVIGLSDGASDMLQEERTVESGQIVWDKHRHWKSLCLATYYNYYGSRYYYTLISQGWAGWGDKDTFPMALKAYREPYYQVPHDIITAFVYGTTHGVGMVQSNPANDTSAEPLFLHSNIVKWSVEEFLCLGCPPSTNKASSTSALENTGSPIHSHLKEGKRIFATESFKEAGMDPEPLLWKCMEYSACRSVWGSSQLCKQTRDYMTKTFRYQFKPSRTASMIGYGDRVCVVDPR